MKIDEGARRIWVELVKIARNKETPISYSTLMQRIDGRTPRLGRELEPIQQYCIDEHLPPLTMLIVGKHRGTPGTGFIASDPVDAEHDLERVRNERWPDTNPFDYAARGHTISDLAKSIAADPEKSETVYILVKSRGIAQQIFRSSVLQFYSCCAICGITNRTCLQAAHLIPFHEADQQNRVSPTNGLLLCANHHLMFDRHEVAIDPEGFIRYFKPKGLQSYSDLDRTLTTERHGKIAFFPAKKSSHPSSKALLYRYGMFLKHEHQSI